MEFFLQAQVLAANSSLMPLPQHDLLVHKYFFSQFTFWMCKGIILINLCFGTISFVTTSSDVTSTFTTLHLKLNGHFLLFLEDYEPN
jgi:hypothetical protein